MSNFMHGVAERMTHLSVGCLGQIRHPRFRYASKGLPERFPSESAYLTVMDRRADAQPSIQTRPGVVLIRLGIPDNPI